MKKLLLATLFGILSVVFARAQHTYIHITNEGFSRQSYHSVLTPDDNLIIEEAVFASVTEDLGIKFLKVNPHGILLDSVFVESHTITRYALFERDPHSEDGSLYIDIVRDTSAGHCRYTALSLGDDMVIRHNISVDLPISSDIYRQRLWMKDDYILSGWCNEGLDTCRFAKIDLDGNIMCMSEPVAVSNGTFTPMNRPWFLIDEEPLRIGFLRLGDSNMGGRWLLIDVLDGDMNYMETKRIGGLGGFKHWNSSFTEAAYLGEGEFVIVGRVSSIYSNMKMGVEKFNRNFESMGGMRIDSISSPDFPIRPVVDKKDGSFYFMWLKGSKYHLKHMSRNMEELWDKIFMKSEDITTIPESVSVREDGGAAVSGWVWLPNAPANVYNVFASFVDGTYETVPEHQSEDTSFSCYPNPSNGKTTVSFAVENDSEVAINVLDSFGNIVRHIDCGRQNSGNHEIDIDLSDLPEGMYFCGITTGDGKKEMVKVLIRH